MLTDTHCHLDFDHFKEDRIAVLARAWRAGLDRILVPGVDQGSSRSAINVAEEDHRIYAAVGVHPNSALSWNDDTYANILKYSRHPKVAAIGEIGLDYYRDRAPVIVQKRVFQAQLELAERQQLPVVIHTRNASPTDRRCIQDLTGILDAWKPSLKNPGVIHSYSGNEMEAERLMALGYYIGITGPITYKNASELRNVVKKLPLERILIETDGPFLTPHPYRGKRNEPAYVRFIAERISEVHQCPLQVVIEQTALNAHLLFRWREAEAG